MSARPSSSDGSGTPKPSGFRTAASAAAAPRSWQLGQVRRRARLVIVAVELITGVVVATEAHAFEFRSEYLVRWLLLAGLSILYSVAAARLERMRRYLSAAAHVSMTSVWAFAAVLCLPSLYAAALVTLLFVLSSWERRRQGRFVPHRVIYNASTAVLSALAAAASRTLVHSHVPAWETGATSLATVVALAVYFCVNTGLVLTTIHLAAGPMPLRELLPEREELSLEIGTLILGILTAETIVAQPWLTPSVLVLMVLLQRSSLVSQLEVAAATDAKTGLLNAAAWQELAQRELVRAQHESAPCALLLLDLDHFKRVNDTLGHLAGDLALRAIGDALKRELRGHDAVARFGGEEFVVFLDGLAPADAVLVAERTLTRIRGLQINGPATNGPTIHLTASIGLASYPQHGIDLTELLESADAGLYVAKRAGRDQVGLPPEAAPEAAPATESV